MSASDATRERAFTRATRRMAHAARWPAHTTRRAIGVLPGTTASAGDVAVDATDHLEELRWRIVWVLGTFALAFAAAFAFRDAIFALLERPLDGRHELVTLGVTEPFFTSLTVAGNVAAAITIPMLVAQAWLFVAPGIPPDARRVARPWVWSVPLLFAAGVAFGFYVVLGPATQFLLGFAGDTFNVQVRAAEYFRFATLTLLSIGALFLLPAVIMTLAAIGAVTARGLRAKRRVAYLAMAVVAMLLPTIDPVSLLLEMVPLIVLYEASIVLVALRERTARRSSDAEHVA